MSTAVINWVLPTQRVDNSALSPAEIAGVDVFDDASPTPAVPIGTAGGAATSFTTGVLSVGTHNFTMVLRDTAGHSSVASSPVAGVVAATLANPMPVTGVTVTINP